MEVTGHLHRNAEPWNGRSLTLSIPTGIESMRVLFPLLPFYLPFCRTQHRPFEIPACLTENLADDPARQGTIGGHSEGLLAVFWWGSGQNLPQFDVHQWAEVVIENIIVSQQTEMHSSTALNSLKTNLPDLWTTMSGVRCWRPITSSIQNALNHRTNRSIAGDLGQPAIGTNQHVC